MCEAGLAPAAVSVEACRGDDLLDEAIWPVYPPVAARYGVPAPTCSNAAPSWARPAVLNLAGIVAESLTIDRNTPPARLWSHRTEHRGRRA